MLLTFAYVGDKRSWKGKSVEDCFIVECISSSYRQKLLNLVLNLTHFPASVCKLFNSPTLKKSKVTQWEGWHFPGSRILILW